MERISSRQNPLVRRFRELASRTVAQGGFDALDVVLDGEHLLREALASNVRVEVAAFADTLLNGRLQSLAAAIADRGGRVVSVSPSVLSAMTPVRQPSGVVAVASLRRATIDDAMRETPQLVLLLGDVQDPGNVGAIVRAGEACGVTGVVTSAASADPYGWKALRGSMGSTFRVPVAARVSLEEPAEAARARGIKLFATVPRGGRPLPDVDLTGASAIVLGGEGQGVADSLLELADERLSIPMREPVESLNVGVAAALIAYEASRQRARGTPRGTR